MNPDDPTTLHDYSTPPPPTPPKHKITKWKIIMGGVAAFLIALFVVAGLTTHSKTTNKVSAGTAQRAASQPAYTQSASPQPPTCLQQTLTWRDNGAEKNVDAMGTEDSTLGTDMQQLSTDMSAGNSTTADVNTVAGDTGSLLGTVEALKQNMPPSCVKNLDKDFGAALDNQEKAGIDVTLMTGALNQNNITEAAADLLLFNTAISDTETALGAAKTDLGTLNGS